MLLFGIRCITLKDKRFFFFFASVIANIPNFRLLKYKEKCIWLMTCEDKAVVRDLADFIY